MPTIRPTQRRVDALRPRRKVCDIRDAELKGYGARVMPSGARRYFIHGQHRGKRVWKTIGDAGVLAEPEARARARSMLAALRMQRCGMRLGAVKTIGSAGAEEPARALFVGIFRGNMCRA